LEEFAEEFRAELAGFIHGADVGQDAFAGETVDGVLE
jgi:hypothetical protein